MTQHKAIDWALCVSLANNKPQVAEELLTMFTESLPKFQQDILVAFQQQDMQKLRDHIHKLHGGACYVGVPKLKTTAAEIETLIKKNNLDNLDIMIVTLLTEITNILVEYKNQDFR